MKNYPVYKKRPFSRCSRFRFQWTDGNTSLNDNGIKIIKAHNREFCYILQQLHVLVRGQWRQVKYVKIPYKENAFEMLIWHM